MSNKIVRKAFQRRSFELHLAALVRLRRQQGHRSFFDEQGYVRGYAQAYLQQWLAADLPEGAGNIPRLHIDATIEVTLEELATRLAKGRQLSIAHHFLEILRILDSEETALYHDNDEYDVHEAQMKEYRSAYTVIDNPYWDRSDEDDNLVYLR